MLKKIFPLLVVLLFSLTENMTAQVKTNLDMFYALADSSAIMLKGKDACIKLNSSGSYLVFSNTIYKTAAQNNIKTCSGDEKGFISLSFDSASVKYPEMFRDGFLGTHLVKREVKLSGNYYSLNEGYKPFSFSSVDTVRVDEVKNLEDESIPFTRGELPAEPFFSGLLEPAAAIGTAAAIIILYFTVRSK